MKQFWMLLLLVAIGFVNCHAQQADHDLAAKIAEKMRDSLGLTSKQTADVYEVNVRMATMKKNLRDQFTNPDILRKNMQLIENKRDSLYMLLLSPSQYLNYRQKKRSLINNN